MDKQIKKTLASNVELIPRSHCKSNIENQPRRQVWLHGDTEEEPVIQRTRFLKVVRFTCDSWWREDESEVLAAS